MNVNMAGIIPAAGSGRADEREQWSRMYMLSEEDSHETSNHAYDGRANLELGLPFADMNVLQADLASAHH